MQDKRILLTPLQLGHRSLTGNYLTGPEVIEKNFIPNLAEHEIFPAHKY